MTEEWRSVPGWEEFYEVSSSGAVRSLDRPFTYRTGRTIIRPGRMLRQIPLPSGHLRVALSANGVWRKYLVHRLVLEAFVGPCPPQHEALHYNDDPGDNRLANLRCGTRAENMTDAERNGRMRHWRKEQCIHGHPMTTENTYEHAGRRHCRACKKIWEAKHGG